MQGMAVDRLADVLQPAGDQEAREVEAARGLGIAAPPAGMAKTGRRLPGDLPAAPPQRPDIERVVGERPEVEAATGAEGQCPHALLVAVAEHDLAHAGDLAKVADPVAQRVGCHAACAGKAISSRRNASGGASFLAISPAISRIRRRSCASSRIGLSWPGSVSRS